MSAALADTCLALGVDTTFGLIGSGNFVLTHRLVAGGARAVAARHEGGVVSMTDSWAQATGRVGFCTLHQGPGFTNALTALVEASRSRTPMVVFVAETARFDWQANQRLDPSGLAREGGAHVERIRDPRDAVPALLRAWRVATQARTPVVLSVPVDVQAAPAPAPADPDAIRFLRTGAGRTQLALDTDAADRAAELIAASERPVVLAGRGAVLDQAVAELVALADQMGALLATTAQAQNLFADHPWSVGVSGGFAAPAVLELLANSDLVLAFGASLNPWTAGHGAALTSSARVIQIDIEPTAFGHHRTPALTIVGNVRAVATALHDRVPPANGYRGHLGDLGDVSWPLQDRPVTPGTVDPAVLARALDSMVPKERNITYDGGHFAWFPMRHFKPSSNGVALLPQSFQCVGLGLSSAVGVAVARPELPTVLFTGDGGALMALGELDSLVMSGEKVLVVVMDDGAYGAEVHHFGSDGLDTAIVEFGTRDFAGVAQALGARGSTIRSLADLDVALEPWLQHDAGVLVLDCKVDPAIGSEQMDLPFRAER